MAKSIKKLYRYCSALEVRNFLLQGYIEPLHLDYISLTENSTPNKRFDVSDPKWSYVITFNAECIFDQGGYSVEYTKDFFLNNPVVLEHISGYKFVGKQKKEFRVDYPNYLSFVEAMILKCKQENEVLVKSLTCEKGMILSIDKFITGGQKIKVV